MASLNVCYLVVDSKFDWKWSLLWPPRLSILHQLDVRMSHLILSSSIAIKFVRHYARDVADNSARIFSDPVESVMPNKRFFTAILETHDAGHLVLAVTEHHDLDLMIHKNGSASRTAT